MSKLWIHAESSAKRFGGRPELMRILTPEKDRIRERVHALMAEWYPQHPPGQRCIYWMHVTLVAMMEFGYKAYPMCGSMEFRVNNHGYGPTHCGWSDGLIHCWCYHNNQVIDFSAFDLPRVCELSGMKWERPALPPDYLWDDPAFLWQAGYHYRPNRDATVQAVNMINGDVSNTKGFITYDRQPNQHPAPHAGA